MFHIFCRILILQNMYIWKCSVLDARNSFFVEFVLKIRNFTRKKRLVILWNKTINRIQQQFCSVWFYFVCFSFLITNQRCFFKRNCLILFFVMLARTEDSDFTKPMKNVLDNWLFFNMKSIVCLFFNNWSVIFLQTKQSEFGL